MTTTDPSVPSPAELETRRQQIREAHLRPSGERPASTARGLHHTALVSSDVERTVRFYQDVLGFPLTELIENRDYPGLVALLLRHRQLQPAGLLRLPRARRRALRRGARRAAPHGDLGRARAAGSALVERLAAAGVEHEVHSGVSVYFRDPDGARIELIADPLGEMYGNQVL